MPTPVSIGTLLLDSPKNYTANFIITGKATANPQSRDKAIGTILNVYVKSESSGVSKYLARFPEIVRTTTKVYMIQKGPYKSGFF